VGWVASRMKRAHRFRQPWCRCSIAF